MQQSIKLPTLEAFTWDSKRINPQVLDLYGVGLDSNGRITSPHYSPDMQLLAVHSRSPGERDFRMQGSNCPIGLHTLGNNLAELIIVEGHSDVYAAKTVFPHADVIGLPGSNTVSTLTKYLSKLIKYKRITIMTDGDEAGTKCGDALMELLPPSKTYRTSLAEGMDVCDYLTNRREDELKQVHAMSTSNKRSLFVTPEDCEKYAEESDSNVVPTGIDTLDMLLGGGLGLAELTLLTGYTGTGKSALSQFLAVQMAKQGHKVIYIAGEMTPSQNLNRLVRQWYGGIIKKSELKDCYVTVSSNILISKLSELSLSSVRDVITSGVLDEGARVVIIDVLSDINGFDDYVEAGKIIKSIHSMSRGNITDGIPEFAVLAVAHTKGSDEGPVRIDSIRGGSTIRQESTCVLAIEEVARNDMDNTHRRISLIKRPRNREYARTTTTLQYDITSNRYSEIEPITLTQPVQQHASTSEVSQSEVRLQVRGTLSQSKPTSTVPSTSPVSLGESQPLQGVSETIPDTESNAAGTTTSDVSHIQSRLPMSTDRDTSRDEGNTESGRQTQVTASVTHSSGQAVQVSGTSITEVDVRHGTESNVESEESVRQRKLDSLRIMYDKHPDILERHLRIVQTDKGDAIRRNLTDLGLLTRET
jgi:5S rRNA maturation endonuclease (ribonuclease M5)